MKFLKNNIDSKDFAISFLKEFTKMFSSFSSYKFVLQVYTPFKCFTKRVEAVVF